MNSHKPTTSTPIKAAAAAPALTPPILKLSSTASAQNGNVNANLAKAGIFSATAPTGGTIGAYFFGPATESKFPKQPSTQDHLLRSNFGPRIWPCLETVQ